MLLLIDANGIELTPSTGVQAAFGTKLPPEQFCNYMVKNLGFVMLECSPLRSELRFRPEKVRPKALAAALDKYRSILAHRYA